MYKCAICEKQIEGRQPKVLFHSKALGEDILICDVCDRHVSALKSGGGILARERARRYLSGHLRGIRNRSVKKYVRTLVEGNGASGDAAAGRTAGGEAAPGGANPREGTGGPAGTRGERARGGRAGVKRGNVGKALAVIAVCLALCLPLRLCTGSHAGVYRGRYNMFRLTLTLKSGGEYVFEQYEPLTGGITERGKYRIKGSEIDYYDSSGARLKYTGTIRGDAVTLGRLEMRK